MAEAFAKVLPRWRDGGVEQPGQYLRRALVNELTGGFRRRAIERRVTALRSGDGRAVERMDALVGERDAMRRALLALPVGQQAVLALRFYEDLTETDTAAILGVSLGTVKSRTFRAMARLRELLYEEIIDA